MFTNGQIIIAKSFSYINKSGGTGVSNMPPYFETFNKPAKFKVIKYWYDYECGYRSWCIPIETESELLEYLNRNAKKGKPNIEDIEGEPSNDDFYVCFISEFEVIS